VRVFRLAPLLLLLAACSRPDSSTAKAPEPSRPEPSRPEPLPTGEPLGTAHPLRYLQSPPDAHWLAVHQVREDRNGDGRADSSPYLLFGPGPGEHIDAFCASDPLGRYLVIVRGDSTWLIDSYTRAETRLGPRPNPLDPVFIGGGSLFEPPCAQFSADGRRLLRWLGRQRRGGPRPGGTAVRRGPWPRARGPAVASDAPLVVREGGAGRRPNGLRGRGSAAGPSHHPGRRDNLLGNRT